MSIKGRCKFCIRLYRNSLSGLENVFEVAQRELESCLTTEDDSESDGFVSISYYQPRIWPGGSIASASAEAPDGADCLSEVGSDDDTNIDGLIEMITD